MCMCVCVFVCTYVCIIICVKAAVVRLLVFAFVQILPKHLTIVSQMLEEDVKSPEIIALLPRSVAAVQKWEASLPLHHLITVEGSWPTACCYLTCEVGPQITSVVTDGFGVKPKNAQTGDGHTLESNGPPEHQQHGKEIGLANLQREMGYDHICIYLCRRACQVPCTSLFTSVERFNCRYDILTFSCRLHRLGSLTGCSSRDPSSHSNYRAVGARPLHPYPALHHGPRGPVSHTRRIPQSLTCHDRSNHVRLQSRECTERRGKSL